MRRKQRNYAILLTAIITAITLYWTHHRNSTDATPIPSTPTQNVLRPSAEPTQWETITVMPGDTVSAIFDRANIPQAHLVRLLQNKAIASAFKNIHPGDQLSFSVPHSETALQLKLLTTHERVQHITETGQTITLTETELTPISKPVNIHFSLQKNLAHDAHQAGLTSQQIYQVSQIFSGQIDFRRQLHQGDTFSVLYNSLTYPHHAPTRGPILATQLQTRSKTYTAVRFQDGQHSANYYQPSGASITPLFLRWPLHFKRISSRFTYHRYDPVLHIMHPHLGVDFAAPYGTTIHAIGDGKIIFMGKKGGYGNTIIIRFNKKYTALHGHLSGFAKNLHLYQHVKKGQVIGYVGSSGWSTGPHLHFGMYVNGQLKDPLKLHFVGGQSISKKHMAAFKATANERLSLTQQNNEQPST